jgi:hypothetical protein
MTIDPERLRRAVHALSGMVLTTEQAQRLAGDLGSQEEILPWIVLRSGAWEKGGEVDHVLRRRAATATRPVTSREVSSTDRRAAQLSYDAMSEHFAAAIQRDQENAPADRAAAIARSRHDRFGGREQNQKSDKDD